MLSAGLVGREDGESVGVTVGTGEAVGAGVTVGTGEAVGVGVTAGAALFDETPLFQTNFFPDFMQVNLFP